MREQNYIFSPRILIVSPRSNAPFGHMIVLCSKQAGHTSRDSCAKSFRYPNLIFWIYKLTTTVTGIAMSLPET